jgi:hypothetical protein
MVRMANHMKSAATKIHRKLEPEFHAHEKRAALVAAAGG